MLPATPSCWSALFEMPAVQQQLRSIEATLTEEVANGYTLCPPIAQVFRAFERTDPTTLRAVCLAQDPYHNGAATGLCFDVKTGFPTNPSYRNILAELTNSGITPQRIDGNLEHWADQGILMLNHALTTTSGSAGAHSTLWAPFTKMVICYLKGLPVPLDWILLGRFAQDEYLKARVSPNPVTHVTHMASHPSPLGANQPCNGTPAFLGSGVFARMTQIRW